MSSSRTSRIKAVAALAAAGTLLAFASGCATIWCGTREGVEIRTKGVRADVFVNGDFVGKTPLEIEMDVQSPQHVVLTAEGYADTNIQIARETSLALMTNFLTGPVALLGFPLDARAGATATFSENEIDVPLLRPNENEKAFYGGNVLLTNVAPDMTTVRDLLHGAFAEEVEKRKVRPKRGNVRAVFVSSGASGTYVRYEEDSTNRSSGKFDVQVEVGERGKIVSFREIACEDSVSTLRPAFLATMENVRDTFVAPEIVKEFLPLTIIVPVVYKDGK